MTQTDNAHFEDEVRRIARLRWVSASYDGAAMLDGRERDGIFETEEMLHAIECTTSRRKDKAQEDCNKLSKLIKQLRLKYPQKGVKGWFITAEEPTVDQRETVKAFGTDIAACSFAQFRSALIDSQNYLDYRSAHAFGSAANPEDNSKNLADEPYVPVNLSNANDLAMLTFHEFLDLLISGSTRALILGDFGAGKSMTMREIFIKLRDAYNTRKASRFPIHLNLREHQGQSATDEALHRHASKIGFPPSQLIRAWRAGFADLLLDGFDEIATSGWAGFNKKLRDIRHANLALVREFIREAPQGTSILIAGRQHYFDSPAEMRKALGSGTAFQEVLIDEFTPAQVSEFLRKRRLSGRIPNWLPPRPLLIGYLFSKSLLSAEDGSVAVSQAVGWDRLLDRICEREARIESGLDGGTIREIVERLATLARTGGDGLGPFTRDDLARAFTEVCGYPPQVGSDVILLRLPGIGNLSADDGTRSFIDEDIADVARAGDVGRFIRSPFAPEVRVVSNVQYGLGDLGAAVAAEQLASANLKSGNFAIAIERSESERKSDGGTLGMDIVRVAQSLDIPIAGKESYVRTGYSEAMSFSPDGPDLSSVRFNDCVFGRITIERDTEPERLPVFLSCYIGLLEGRASLEDLPPNHFIGCEVEEFSASAGTNADILEMDITPGVRVLLTVLRKLFLQAGRGRQESALFRGLDHRVRRFVPEVLRLLAAEDIASETKSGGNTIWIPNRSKTGRIRALLARPNSNTDPLIRECIKIE